MDVVSSAINGSRDSDGALGEQVLRSSYGNCLAHDHRESTTPLSLSNNRIRDSHPASRGLQFLRLLGPNLRHFIRYVLFHALFSKSV